MRSALRLMPLFLRRDGARNEIASAGLTAIGVAVATALTLTVLSFLPGLSGRADRMAWREPTPVALDRATAVQERSVDLFEGRVIDRVDLAPYGAAAELTSPGADDPSPAPRRAAVGHTGTDLSVSANLAVAPSLAVDLPAPPGLDEFPEAGEVYVSPAMARLLRDTPSDELGDRFPGRIAGTIGSAGLAHEDELVVVVGRAAGDLVPVEGPSRLSNPDERMPSEPSPVTAVSSFATSGSDSLLTTYWQAIAVIAVLLTVPAVLLIGSAARLTAARRNQRLAALRLAGATPSGVVVLTAAETALAALVGAVAGLGLYGLLLPLTARFALAGGPWAVSDLWLGVGPALATLVVVPVIAALSATVALRLVSVSPLGVAQGVSTRRPRLVRFLSVGVAWLVLAAAATSVRDGGGIAALLIGVGAVMASLGLVGPWIAWALGKVIAGVSRRPSTLLAGRRIVDDPKAAYRAVSGIVLAGFIAGLLFAISPTIDQRHVDGRPSHSLQVFVGGEELDAVVVPAAEARLAAAGLDAAVELDDMGGLSVLPDDPADMERVRTTLTGLVPHNPLVGDDEFIVGGEDEFGDYRRTTVVLLLAAMLMAATATGIGSAASVLDQSETLGRLRLAGTPIGVLQRARMWHAALPLVTATTVSLASGMGTAYMLLFAGGAPGDEVQPPDVASIGAVLLFGLVLGLASAAVTRPLLVAATTTEMT